MNRRKGIFITESIDIFLKIISVTKEKECLIHWILIKFQKIFRIFNRIFLRGICLKNNTKHWTTSIISLWTFHFIPKSKKIAWIFCIFTLLRNTFHKKSFVRSRLKNSNEISIDKFEFLHPESEEFRWKFQWIWSIKREKSVRTVACNEIPVGAWLIRMITSPRTGTFNGIVQRFSVARKDLFIRFQDEKSIIDAKRNSLPNFMGFLIITEDFLLFIIEQFNIRTTTIPIQINVFLHLLHFFSS